MENTKDDLRKWLHDHERSVSWLARLFEVSRTSTHSWLSGDARPGEFHRQCLEALTGIPAENWMSERELKKEKSNNETMARIEKYMNERLQ